jgi:hypothetical protein
MDPTLKGEGLSAYYQRITVVFGMSDPLTVSDQSEFLPKAV